MSFDEENGDLTLKDIIIFVEKISNKVKEQSKIIKDQNMTIESLQNQLTELTGKQQDLERVLQSVDYSKVEDDIKLLNEDINNLKERNVLIITEIKEIKEKLDNETININQLSSKVANNNEQLIEGINKLENQFTTKLAVVKEEMTAIQDTVTKNHNQLVAADSELVSKIESVDEKFNEIVDELKKHTQNKLQELESKVDEVKESLKETVTRLTEQIENISIKILDQIEGVTNDFTEQLDANISELNGKIIENSQLIADRHNKYTKSFEIVTNGLQLANNKINDNKEVIDLINKNLNKIKTNIDDIISVVREDQKKLLENVNRVIFSELETIRTEIALVAQKLQEKDSQILKTMQETYYNKREGEQLQKQIKNLEAEIQEKANKTRDELIDSLKKSLDSYENIFQEQVESTKQYQQELENLKNETLTIVERSVNEKFEIVFSLLSDVKTRAQELALLIKNAEIIFHRSPEKQVENDSDSEETLQNNSNEYQ